ncbi:PAS domain S-box protein [Methanobacterium alcaliphilum]|uniref:PAS domain S-box protein n=1 Tax=Methanobacterium alcaliphilum TaxID=392018 RepID=UPI00200B6A18|nr:PAS domain S-box protein [Methanobacterium alcaliphilum]MCK9151580.1 PAS domain S-box protein [Methanobacterium alcaliphilum]
MTPKNYLKLSVGLLITFGVLLILFQQATPSNYNHRAVASSIILPIANLFVVYLLFKALKKSKEYGRNYYLAWTIIFLAQVIWFFSDFHWTILELVFNQPSYETEHFIPYALYSMLFSAGLLILPRPQLSILKRAIRIVDIGIMITIIFMMIWAFLIESAVAYSHNDLYNLIIISLFIITQFIFIFVNITVFFRNAGQLRNRPVSFLILGALILILAAAIFGFYSAQNTYLSGGVADFICLTAYLCIGYAAVLQITQKQCESIKDLSYKSKFMNLAITPYLIPVWGFTFYLSIIWIYYSNPRIFLNMLLATSLVIGLVLFRLMLTMREARSERKTAEENEKKAMALIENSIDAIIIMSHEKEIVQWNNGAEKIFGYKSEEILGKKIDFITPKEHIEEFNEILTHITQNSSLKKLDKILGHEKPNRTVQKLNEILEFTFIRKNGQKFPVEISLTFWPLNDNFMMAAIIRDVTERKRNIELLEKSESKFRNVIEQSYDGIVLCKKGGQIVEWNRAAEYITELKKEEVIGKFLIDIMLNYSPKKMLPNVQENIEKTLENLFYDFEIPEDVKTLTFTLKTPSGVIKNIEKTSFPLITLDDPVLCVVLHDITKQKKAEDDLKSSLEEKKVLLMEIHHRVKNHLQIISSLLSLQSLTFEDEQIVNALVEIQNRVQTIAMTHENLYQSSNLSKINMKIYILKIINNLTRTYEKETLNLTIIPQIDQVYLNIETASPCGLIINELMTNSIKYAFPHDLNGKICIELTKKDDDLFLKISDDGIGLPDNFDYDKTNTLGLRLVKSLTRQMNADLKVDMSEGTCFQIRFNELKYKKRI